MRVLLTGAPSSSTGGIALTAKPCALASSASCAALPSRLRPNDQFTPMATSRRSGKMRATSATKAAGESSRKAASNFTATTATAPRARM
jgi:hypothetical protein